jgi:glycosyltransferase involved in cell wall biosynthesis
LVFAYKFSVIIPTFNRANLLYRCLESLVSQGYRDFEVLVCDDGSNDNSREVATSFKNLLNIKYLWDENWGGPARPRNRGIGVATGEWLCFLDSDDWWTPDKLEEMNKYLNDYDLIYHGMEISGSTIANFKKQVIKTHQLEGDIAVDLLLHTNIIPNSSVAIRRSIVEAIGLFSEERELIGVEDFDYWLRAAQITRRFKFVPQNLGYYWVGENISSSLRHSEKEVFLYNKYKNLLTDSQWLLATYMLKYNKARILQHNRCFKSAILQYINILFSKLSIRLKLNSFIFLLLCIVRVDL